MSNPSKESSNPPQTTGVKTTVHWAVKVWLAFHLFMMVAWSLPMGNPEVRLGEKPAGTFDRLWIANDQYVRESPLNNYMTRTGLWQYWDMFAPNPLSVDYYIDAVVQHADGTLTENNFPRIATMPMWQKYPYERFRKFTERLHPRENQFLWPDAAYRVALHEATDPKNPPVKVTLMFYFRQVGPPGNDPDVDRYIPQTLYVLVVDQQRLALDKGWSLNR